MNKILLTTTIMSMFVVSGCATYGGYTPTVDDSVYRQTQKPQQSYQVTPPPPQQLYQRQQVLDKKGKPILDQHGKPVYEQVPIVDQNGNPVYQQAAPAPVQSYQPQQQGPANSASQDSVECQQIARNAANTGTEAVEGGLVGGLVGAAGGAALGAILGNPGTGAAIGAATGGIGGGAYSGLSADQKYQQAFKNCMRNRGHNVLD
ncbi:glycine zipper family protein [Methylomonas sp. AM2-LC]|uniref:glycine zipper family protein n=1 Tax=Methylomonas sp. AM2-LC TaxID=3153301 RepID=UPI00326469FD